MLNKIKQLFLIITFLLISNTVMINNVIAQDSNWIINNFDSNITINQNATINIKETIDVDFYTNQKHGIYRNIPVKYKDSLGQNLNLNLKVNSVKDQAGNNYNYEISNSDNDKVIKIGSADKTITGKNTYIINYEIKNAINYFPNYDELYWNVTGNEWDVIIEHASATINLPPEITKDKLQAKLFTGIYSSQNENGKIDLSDSKIFYQTNQELNPGQGLTIVAGWPINIIHKPTAIEKAWTTLVNNIYYFIPIIAFFILLNLYLKHGRDPKGRGIIVPEFTIPKNLTPLEIGAIIKETINHQDISATIIDLAIRKYIKIDVKEKKGYFGKSHEIAFIKLKSADNELNDFEQTLLSGIFDDKKEIKLKDIKDFNKTFNNIKNQVFAKMTADGYFPKHPTHIKSIFLTIGIVVLPISFFIYFGNLSFNISMLVTGLLFIIFAPFMPKKTPKGVELKEKILGLKLYLKTAERYRLKFQEKAQIFEKFLPVAISLGIATVWAGKFKHIYQNNSPYWYHGYPGYIYVPTALIADLDTMQSTVSNISAASSGGSGFSSGGSGGGFGGGGGGSW